MTFKLELEKIVGKERHRTDPRTGRNYTPKQTRLAEEAVRKAYRAEHEGHGDFDGIVTVAIETFRPLAKSNPKYWVGRADLGKPDWDNIGKLICDALNGVAYTDDAHVVMGGVQKGCRTPYGTPPLAKVRITHFTEEYIIDYDEDEGEPLPFDRPANVDAETGEVYEVITDEARMIGDGE